jgi:hypothetical protein
MPVALQDHTVALIESRMKELGFDSADKLIEAALNHLDEERGEFYEDLDAETRAAIEEGEAQYQRGEGRPVAELRQALAARFGLPAGDP